MRQHLREINQSLYALDEAHRLGRISREDYRARRRHLLGTLCDGGGITARDSLTAPTAPRERVDDSAAPAAQRDESMSELFPPPWWTRLFFWRRRPTRRR